MAINRTSGLSETSSLSEWLSWQEQCHVKEIDLGLERVAKVYQSLNPVPSQQIYTITVAGTNGKGSCVAFLEAILIAAGYQVGVYSTPHLVSYNERVRINGEKVSDALLTNSFSKIDKLRQDVSLSYFEFGTLAALDVFSSQKVDIQILEVGLGGRLDAVNIIDANAALISSISLDHVDWLGDDLQQIALEKAGVFRTNQVAVCGDKTVPESLIDYAKKLDTKLALAGNDFDFKVDKNGWLLKAEHSLAGHYPFPSLLGSHQIQNACAVISLLAQIRHAFSINKDSVKYGLQHAFLKGRLQQVNSAPDIFLDVAHNSESAEALADFIKAKNHKGRVHAVFSILADKQLKQVIQPLIGLVDQWHVAPLKTVRAVSIPKLQTVLTKDLAQHCLTYQSIQQAFDEVRHTVNKEDLVICFGSFYVVEACLEAL